MSAAIHNRMYTTTQVREDETPTLTEDIKMMFFCMAEFEKSYSLRNFDEILQMIH